METSSDLVNYFRLEYKAFPGYVEHTRIYSDPARGIRKAKETTQWSRIKEIGQGGFGDVWLEREHGGQLRAVKEIRKYDEMSRKIDYERELLAMAYFSRDSSIFVSFQGWFETTSKVYIAMEYLPLGSLQHCVSTSLAESETKVIVTQILEGLKTMHDQNFSHRDLKPLNIFVVSKSPNWWVKIGDFGISKRVKEGLTMLRTSMSGDYVAPEVMRLLGDDEESFSYSNAVDMWSLGCITSWLLTSFVPFPNGRGLLKYCQREKAFPSDIFQSIRYEAFDFVQKLMYSDPSNRLSAENSLQHTWLKHTSEVSTCSDRSHVHGRAPDGFQSTQRHEQQQHIRIQPVAEPQYPIAYPYRTSSQNKQPEALVVPPGRSHHVPEANRIEDGSNVVTSRKSQAAPDGLGEYYGSQVSLISNTDIRYRGILDEINAEMATIALTKVVSFGTEGRRPGDEIPPSDHTYEYIVFRGRDVKDLKIEVLAKKSEKPLLPQNKQVQAKFPPPQKPPSTIYEKHEPQWTKSPRLNDLRKFFQNLRLKTPVPSDWGHGWSPNFEPQAPNKANEGAKRSKLSNLSSVLQTTDLSRKPKFPNSPAQDSFREEDIKAIEAAQQREAEAEARYQHQERVRLQEAERRAEENEDLMLKMRKSNDRNLSSLPPRDREIP